MGIKREDGNVYWLADDGDKWALDIYRINDTGQKRCLISNEAVKMVCRTIAFLVVVLLTVLGTEAPAQIRTLWYGLYGLRGSILP
jgi:hypothetical protein